MAADAETASASTFSMGSLVWAKMKGFPPWPGRIAEPPSDLKRPTGKKAIHCIYFFGSQNYAWIEENQLKEYQKYKESLVKSNKSAAFKDAVKSIEYYIEHGKESVNGTHDAEDLFDKVKNSISEPVTKPKKKHSFPKDFSSSVTSTPLNAESAIDGDAKPPPKKMKRESRNNTEESKSLSYVRTSHPSTPKKISLLDRPSMIEQPDAPPLDVTAISNEMKYKEIHPTHLKLGFLGLGNAGSGIVKNLLNSGHKVTIWNRTPDKGKEFIKIGAEVAMTPSDVVQMCDITFSCVANPQAAKDMVFGNCGVLSEMSPGKSYVEMTGIDADTSQDIAEAITSKGGRYLEAQMQGSKTDAENGTLVILTAGNKELFNDCQSSFIAMSKHAFFLGDVGNATKMNLIIQLMKGISLAGLGEGLALADRAGLKLKDVMEILSLTSLSCPFFNENGKLMCEGVFTVKTPLQHLQKDLRLSLALGDQVEQPLPLTATANEAYKHAKKLGYAEHDVCSVYVRSRF